MTLQRLFSCPLTIIHDLQHVYAYAGASRDEKLNSCVCKSINVTRSQKMSVSLIQDLCIHLFLKRKGKEGKERKRRKMKKKEGETKEETGKGKNMEKRERGKEKRKWEEKRKEEEEK